VWVSPTLNTHRKAKNFMSMYSRAPLPLTPLGTGYLPSHSGRCPTSIRTRLHSPFGQVDSFAASRSLPFDESPGADTAIGCERQSLNNPEPTNSNYCTDGDTADKLGMPEPGHKRKRHVGKG
ncbi:hypothetical protein FA13DRAFT_1731195, partial [Coprinellus micaceus]